MPQSVNLLLKLSCNDAWVGWYSIMRHRSHALDAQFDLMETHTTLDYYLYVAMVSYEWDQLWFNFLAQETGGQVRKYVAGNYLHSCLHFQGAADSHYTAHKVREIVCAEVRGKKKKILLWFVSVFPACSHRSSVSTPWMDVLVGMRQLGPCRC